MVCIGASVGAPMDGLLFSARSRNGNHVEVVSCGQGKGYMNALSMRGEGWQAAVSSDSRCSSVFW